MPLHDMHIRLHCASGTFNEVICELVTSLSEEFVAENAMVNLTVNQSSLSVVLQKNQSTVAKLKTASSSANKSKIYDKSNNLIKQYPDVSLFDTTLTCELLSGIEDYPTYCGKKRGNIRCTNNCVGKCCNACSHVCTLCHKVKCFKGCTAHSTCNHQCMSCLMDSSDCKYNQNICCSKCTLCGFCNSNFPLSGQCPRYRLKSNIINIRHLRNVCAHGTEKDFDDLNVHNIPLPYFQQYTDWALLSAKLTDILEDFISYLDIKNNQLSFSNAYLSKDKISSFRSELYIALTAPTHKVKFYFDEYLKESSIMEQLNDIATNISEINDNVAYTGKGISEINDNVASANKGISEINDNVASTNKDISEINDNVASTGKYISEIKDDMASANKGISEIKDVMKSLKKANFCMDHVDQSNGNDLSESDHTESNISVECATEFRDYAYNKLHDTFAVVSLKTPCDDATGKRAAMDIVAVIDKSASMNGGKLRLVKIALQFLVTQLGEEDQLSLVTYDKNVYVDYSLRKMSMANKKIVLRKINRIMVGNGTNLCGGLIKGICQIVNRSGMSKNDVASVLLFTDGEANQGITLTATIISAMQNPTEFDVPSMDVYEQQFEYEDHCLSPATEEIFASVYTFGIGADHNSSMLKQISDARNGMYYYIKTQEEIGGSFAHCFGGLMSTIAQGITLEVSTTNGVSIREVHSAKPHKMTNNKSLTVNVGNLLSEESLDVLLKLTIDPVDTCYTATMQCLFSANINYFNVITRKVTDASELLEVFRTEIESCHTILNMNENVTKSNARVNLINSIKEAIFKAEKGHFQEAKAVISTEMHALKELAALSTSFKEGYIAMIIELEQTYVRLNNEAFWKKSGIHEQQNVLQQHEAQRSTSRDSQCFHPSREVTEAMKEFDDFQESRLQQHEVHPSGSAESRL